MIRLKSIILLSLLILLGSVSCLFAQDKQGTASVVVYFQKESAIFEPDYRDNGTRLEEFFRKVDVYLNASSLVGVHVEALGTSSPEGQLLFNEIISRERMNSVRKQLLSRTTVTEDILTETYSAQDWKLLAELVEADPKVTSKDRILDIIRNGGEDRLERMQEVEYARPFWYIYHNIFPDMRACRITIHYKITDPVKSIEPVQQNSIDVPFLTEIRRERPAATAPSLQETPEIEKTAEAKVKETADVEEITTAEEITEIEEIANAEETVETEKTAEIEEITPVEEVTEAEEAPEAEDISEVEDTPETEAEPEIKDKPARKSAPASTERKLTLKTNVIGWGLSVMNVAAELDIAENWSVSLPFYYSGTNYFSKTVKFRCAILQPEVRYHIPQINGLYAGAHLGVGWFNYALGGTYRIQDAGGKRPAWGGGLSVGYKMQFKKNPRWGMEFALGAGIYDAKYDKFYNEPNGPYAAKGLHKTFVGIDNASVSFTYSFDLKKKEDKR